MRKKILAVTMAMMMTFTMIPSIHSFAVDTKTTKRYALPAVGSLTEAQTNMAADAMFDAIVNRNRGDEDTKAYFLEAGIPATSESMQDLLSVFETLATQNEEFVLVRKNTLHTMMGFYDGQPCVKGISFDYFVDSDVYESEYQKCIDTLNFISAKVDPSWRNEEKALYLHDYIAENYKYDSDYNEDDPVCFSAFGMIDRGKAVCEGYAWLYTLLLARQDIRSIECSSDTLWHIWNLVEIESNKWAYVDVTWDDSFGSGYSFSEHTSFLKDADTFRNNHKANDWILTTLEDPASYPVVSNYNDGFWRNSYASACPFRDGWLVLKQDETFASTTGHFCYYQYDEQTSAYTCHELTTISEMWKSMSSNGASSSYFRGSYIAPQVTDASFVAPCVVGEYIFYTMPDSIRAFHFNGEYIDNWYNVYDLTEEEKTQGHIYGMKMEGSVIHYAVATTPLSDAVTNSYDAAEFFDRLRNELNVEMTTESSDTTTTTTTVATTTTTTTVTSTTTSAMTTESVTETTTMPETSSDTVMTTETSTEAVTESSATSETATEATVIETTASTDSAETTTVTTTETTEMTTSETSSETTATTTVSSETTLETVYTDADHVQDTVIVKGDLTGDGTVDIIDVILMSKYLHNRMSFTAKDYPIADINDDGEIDIFDMGLLKRLVVAG